MFIPNDKRYDTMKYNRCGKSGLKLPAVSLGLWQNFGFGSNTLASMEEMCHTAFNLGVTHFDLANNYGNPYNGSAEENFGLILDRGMREFRDELCISTKAGFEMWAGPYGDRSGSRKYLTASLDQSLKRMKLDYVDIFYHHIYDPNTPLEETALALDNAVRQGKALYVGISNYNKEKTAEIHKIFKELRTPFIVNQPSYSMFNRWIEGDGLYDYANANGLGLAVFSPLSGGLLTNRYLNGLPDDQKGRASTRSRVNPETVEKLNKLYEIAQSRGQSMSQLALSWILRKGKVTTVLTGASGAKQIIENVQAANNIEFSDSELDAIEKILK